jgi:hypothetical protein
LHIISETMLVEALAIWGAHEASGRLRGQVQCDTTDKLACIDLALRYRAPYVLRILAREPLSTVLVEIEPRDIASMILADGRSIEAWIESVTTSGGDTYAYFRSLVDDSAPPAGQLIGAAELVNPTANQLSAVVLYDGWHRAAAWAERSKIGQPSNITAFLIVTRKGDPYLVTSTASGQPANDSPEGNAATRASQTES